MPPPISKSSTLRLRAALGPDAAGGGFDLSDSDAHAAPDPFGQSGQGAGSDFALQQISDVRDGRAADVFRGGVFGVETGREIEADFAKDMMDEGGAVEGFLA